MEITFLELRRDPKKLVEAIERREEVTVSRRGCEVARVVPIDAAPNTAEVAAHPAFGIWSDRWDEESPEKLVRRVRRSRFHDL